MPKVVNDLNQIWVESDGGEHVKIGFTRDFLQQLDQCWHILPANNSRFKKQMPLMTVETNDGLVSILSPVTGYLQNFDRKAQDFPDKLTEEDVILSINVAEKKAVKKEPSHDELVAMLRQRMVQPRAAGQRVFIDDATLQQTAVTWAVGAGHTEL
jgi:glycine cleavage system H lipoate-binding protein